VTLNGVMGWKLTPRIVSCIALASGLAAAACASMSPAALSSDLAGTRWLVSLIDGRPSQARQASITFAPEDRITGTAGCNRFTGVYEAAGGSIDVRALGRTEMACAAPVMRDEEALLEVLDNAQRYTRQGERLVITAQDGSNLVLTPASS
jgi:heat shock protein HslJ